MTTSGGPDTAVRAAGRDAVVRALAEDLADGHDVTTAATIPTGLAGGAELVARRPGVLAGLWLVGEVYAQLSDDVEVELTAQDGQRIDPGQAAARIRGPLGVILTGERTALNLVCHLSGIATATRAYVEAVDGTGCVIRDTRKTVPGLRLLAKDAVRAGGGVNHRIGLWDGLLVKDNHVEVAGSVAAATRAALDAAGELPVQVEVDTLEQLDEAITAGARDILLDNLDVAATAEAVARVRALETQRGRILLESSGAITLTDVAAYAATGVDRIAVGAITHSARQLDLGLDVRPVGLDHTASTDEPAER